MAEGAEKEDEGTIQVSSLATVLEYAAKLLPGSGGEKYLANALVNLAKFLDVRGITPDEVFDIDG